MFFTISVVQNHNVLISCPRRILRSVAWGSKGGWCHDDVGLLPIIPGLLVLVELQKRRTIIDSKDHHLDFPLQEVS